MKESSSVVNSAGVKGAYDFLEAKFGYFNSHHPIGHLGYTKGMELDIEDIINCMEEYKSQSSSVVNKDEERKKATEFIAGNAMYIDSLLETNRELGEEIERLKSNNNG